MYLLEVQFQFLTHQIGTPYNLPISGVTTTVYIVRKTINSVGIKTGVGSEFKEVFFRGSGTDSDEYFFE